MSSIRMINLADDMTPRKSVIKLSPIHKKGQEEAKLVNIVQAKMDEFKPRPKLQIRKQPAAEELPQPQDMDELVSKIENEMQNENNEAQGAAQAAPAEPQKQESKMGSLLSSKFDAIRRLYQLKSNKKA